MANSPFQMDRKWILSSASTQPLDLSLAGGGASLHLCVCVCGSLHVCNDLFDCAREFQGQARGSVRCGFAVDAWTYQHACALVHRHLLCLYANLRAYPCVCRSCWHGCVPERRSACACMYQGPTSHVAIFNRAHLVGEGAGPAHVRASPMCPPARLPTAHDRALHW